MNQFIAPADNHSAINNTCGSIKRKLPLWMRVMPHNTFGGEIDAQHFVIKRAVISDAIKNNRRSADIRARWNLVQLFAIRDTYGAEYLIASGDVGNAIYHARRAVNIAVGFGFPQQRPTSRIQAIEILVIRTN